MEKVLRKKDDMDFRQYARNRVKKTDQILEFGPLNRPLFSKQDFEKIFYADIRSTKEIKQLYIANDYLNKTGLNVDISTIVDIDYIIKGTYKKTFGNKKFDIIYLSHVVEHIPDIITFFIEVYDLLTDNGKLIIIYPDKRYCFDHFRNSASFRDAYATYINGTKENARLALDFAYNVVKENNPLFFWNEKKLTDVISENTIEDAKKYYDMSTNNDKIDDIHFWPFSDYDFLLFIYEMKRTNLFYFEIEEYFPTEKNTQEFMIILNKKQKNNIDTQNIKELIDKYNVQNKINDLESSLKNCLNKNNDLELSIEIFLNKTNLIEDENLKLMDNKIELEKELAGVQRKLIKEINKNHVLMQKIKKNKQSKVEKNNATFKVNNKCYKKKRKK